MLVPKHELFHSFKGIITNFQIVTSSCIPISRHDHLYWYVLIPQPPSIF